MRWSKPLYNFLCILPEGNPRYGFLHKIMKFRPKSFDNLPHGLSILNHDRVWKQSFYADSKQLILYTTSDSCQNFRSFLPGVLHDDLLILELICGLGQPGHLSSTLINISAAMWLEAPDIVCTVSAWGKYLNIMIFLNMVSLPLTPFALCTWELESQHQLLSFFSISTPII